MPPSPDAGSVPAAPGARRGTAELHAHSLASDGMVSSEELVVAAAAIGLSVLCVTDHDTIADLSKASDLGARLGVDVVAGEEVTTAWPAATHLIGIFLTRPVRMGMSIEDSVAAIHDQGGMAILPHPFMPTFFASISPRRARRLLETQSVDGIEVRHTAPVLPGTWPRLDRFQAEHHERLGARVGAADSHFGRHDIGRWVTTFSGRTAVDLRRCLAAGTTEPAPAVVPAPPGWRMRLAQQQRSLWWVNRERLAGRIGRGTMPQGGGRPADQPADQRFSGR